MAESKADRIKANQARMESERSAFDALWAEIASLVFPRQNVFFGGGMNAAEWGKHTTPEAVVHDPYAAQALEDGVAAFEGFVMPRGQRWQKLAIEDETLMKRVQNRRWLEALEKRLFKRRNDPQSGFASNVHESGMSLFSFALQSMWIDHRRHPATGQIIGLSYQSEFVGEVWIDLDADGNVMRVHRRLTMTAEQAMMKWGDRSPSEVKKAMNDRKPQRDKVMTFLHVIEPNPAMIRGRLDKAGKPWAACYFCEASGEVFIEGGYHTMPRVVSQFSRAPNATYGSSPVMKALPLIRMLQQIWLDRIVGAELGLKPPLLTMDDVMDSAVIDLRPFGETVGGLDERGNPTVRAMFEAKGDPTDARELTAEARALIDRVFYRDLLQINREMKTHISAARTMEEIAEKGLLLAPLARQEDQWLSRMTERELALMAEIGDMDDMPDDIAKYFEAQGGMDIRYDNQLSHMQEAGKSVAFLNLAQQVGLMAQYDPSYVDEFKLIYPTEKVLPELGRIAGVPASMMATEAEIADKKAERQEKAALEQLAQVAPALSGAANDMAQIGNMGAPGNG